MGKAKDLHIRRVMALAFATPKWADRAAIVAVHDKAAKMRRDGVSVHVTYDYPLTHPLVCGLNVPENLRIMPARENLRKGNAFGGFAARSEEDYTLRECPHGYLLVLGRRWGLVFTGGCEVCNRPRIEAAALKRERRAAEEAEAKEQAERREQHRKQILNDVVAASNARRARRARAEQRRRRKITGGALHAH